MSPPSWPHALRMPIRDLPKYVKIPIVGLAGSPRSNYAPLRLYGPGGKEMKRRTVKKWIMRWHHDRQRAARRSNDSHLRNQSS